MSIEYIAVIADEDYDAFKILVSTPLPREYDMWLRVRERGKLRAMQERDAVCVEVEVRPEEFGAYCKGLKDRTSALRRSTGVRAQKVSPRVACLLSLQGRVGRRWQRSGMRHFI